MIWPRTPPSPDVGPLLLSVKGQEHKKEELHCNRLTPCVFTPRRPIRVAMTNGHLRKMITGQEAILWPFLGFWGAACVSQANRCNCLLINFFLTSKQSDLVGVNQRRFISGAAIVSGQLRPTSAPIAAGRLRDWRA